MKKHIVIAVGLAVLSTSAFATRSRLEALGETSGGSFYIKDTRNIFLNPAHVNEYKNYVITEWGNNPSATSDSEASNRPEGGFFREAGAFSYGVYLGNHLRDQNAAKVANGTNFLGTQNAIDAFIAGEAGLDWGLRVHYGNAKAESATVNQSNQTLGVGLGVVLGDIEVSTNLDILNKSKNQNTGANSDDEFKGDFGYDVNLSYHLGSATVWAGYDRQGSEVRVAGATTENSVAVTEFGIGKTHDVSSSTRIYYSLQYLNTRTVREAQGGNTISANTQKSIPLDIGFEAEATSWLTLRGSVSQSLFYNGQELNGFRTSSNTTDVNAGATLNFGKLKVDGSIGTNGTGTDDAILDTDELLARVGVHYWF